MRPIYLDYNATTPIAEEVLSAMMPYLGEHFGNPSSPHWYGTQTKRAIERARSQVAQAIGAGPDEIVFTSGGSEANNLAIKGAAFALRSKGDHIITSCIEHPSVLEVCRFLEGSGFKVTYLQVDQYGMVDVAELESALKPSTILITIMQANNEVGTIQPIEEIAGIARQRGILFHTDAAQSTGKIPVKVNEMQVDLLSVAGHKFYASKGIGALYIRQGTKLEKQIHGAGHEYGLRAGTENVPYIAGLGCASQLADENLSSISNHTREMRDRLYQILKNEMPSIRLNGHPQRRLPNTLSLGFPEIEAEKLLSETPAIAASAGSACHSGSGEISPVLKAMKVPAQYARGTIRFSTGKYTSSDEIETAAKEIIKSVKRLISAQ